MTDSNVVSLGGYPIESSRRAEFMADMAAAFDCYARDNDEEPEAFVYVLCGLRQPSQTGWITAGASEGASVALLSMAAIHMTAEAARNFDVMEDDE